MSGSHKFYIGHKDKEKHCLSLTRDAADPRYPFATIKDKWVITTDNGLVQSELNRFLKNLSGDADYYQTNLCEAPCTSRFSISMKLDSDMSPDDFDDAINDLCAIAISSCESLLRSFESIIKILNDNGLELYCGPGALESLNGGILCTGKETDYKTPLVLSVKSEEADACIRYALMDNGIMNFDIMELDLSAFEVAIEKVAYILNVMSDKKDGEGSYQYDPIEISSVLASVYKAKNDIEEFLNY